MRLYPFSVPLLWVPNRIIYFVVFFVVDAYVTVSLSFGVNETLHVPIASAKQVIFTGASVVFLPPANEVCKDYFFTGVCLTTGGGGPRSLSRGGSLSRRSLSRGVPAQGVSVMETPPMVTSGW